jgi:tetratricopeptide (TPR) repeat protein
VNFLLYFNSIHHDFLKDDFRLIVENPRIKDFKSFLNSINSKFFAFPDFPYLHYWRPLTLFTFFIDYKLWGLKPSGYHLFNLLVNAFNGILLFLIFYSISEKILYSFFISLFFSIHPSHVEAVSWISGRTDLLATFFIFSAILLFISFLKKKLLLFYIVSTVCFILALLSKENAVLFPLAAVGLIFINTRLEKFTKKTDSSTDPNLIGRHGGILGWGRRPLYILPLFLIDILYIILHSQFSGVQNVVQHFSFKDIFVIFKTIGVYAKTILTPFSPAPYFSMQDFDLRSLEFYVFFLIVLAILGLMILKRKEYRYSLYSLLFFIFLLPVLDPNIVPSYPKIVIRFAYIPALFAGVFFLDTIQLFKNKRLKTLYIGALAFIALIWAVESHSFQVFFKDDFHHYNRLVKDFPDDSSLLLPLALQTAETGDYQQALELVNHALDVNERDQWLDVSELGGLLKANLLVITGNAAQGKTIAEKILGETKKNEMKYYAFLVLAKFHEKKHDYSTSLNLLKKAESFGETSDLFFRMTIIYAKMKNYQTALLYLEKAKELNPEIPGYSKLKQFLLNEQSPRQGDPLKKEYKQ